MAGVELGEHWGLRLGRVRQRNQGFPYRQKQTKGVEKQATSIKTVIGNRT